MIARSFPVNDRKSKTSRWDAYYANLDMAAYLKTLEYDEVTGFIDRHVDSLPRDARILDVGCGGGRHLVHLADKGFTNLVGLDLSIHGIRNLRRHRPNLDALVGDATCLPYRDASFDLVVMVGIVYEIPDSSLHERVFAEIRRILRPGGKFIFINNSPYHLGERIYSLTQTLEQAARPRQTKFFVWRYTREDVKLLAQHTGLRIEEESPRNLRRGVFRFLYGIFVPGKVKRQRKAQLSKTDGQPYSIHEYYLVSKDRGLLTPLGNLIADAAARLCPFVFANSICYQFSVVPAHAREASCTSQETSRSS